MHYYHHQIPYKTLSATTTLLLSDECCKNIIDTILTVKVRSSGSAVKGCLCHQERRFCVAASERQLSSQSKERRRTFIPPHTDRQSPVSFLSKHKAHGFGLGIWKKRLTEKYFSLLFRDHSCRRSSSGENWWGKTAANADKMILSDSSRLHEIPGVSYAASNVGKFSGNGMVMSGSEAGMNNNNQPAVFQPKRVLILTKMSRLEFERMKNQEMSETQLESELKRRGSDYFGLLERHNQHKNYLDTIRKQLEMRNIEQRLVQRWDYSEEALDWADAVFTAGGDGTFLLGASKIRNRNKPVIGINTDPVSSEGYLCLMKKLPESHFSEALDKLLTGNFSWLWRQRIRVSMSGKDMWADPVELHDQQLLYPEYRWSEHMQEGESGRNRSHSSPRTPYVNPPPPDSNLSGVDQLASGWINGGLLNGEAENGTRNGDKERVLPFLALNDVYIGESLSSRVSYYELKVDDGPKVKQKSSGITICTGTGSTSWHFNINKLTDQCVSDLMKIMGRELNVHLPKDDPEVVSKLCRKFNDQLLFSPSDLRVAYTVRDPVYNATFQPIAPRGFAQTIRVKSRCFDAHLVIDGGMSYLFNDGAKAKIELRPEDALRTVIFR